MRVLHVLDHSIPLQSGYSFRTLAILKEQRALGWETEQLTSPKQEAGTVLEETVEGLRFYRTPAASTWHGRLPGLGELELMRRTGRRLGQIVERVQPDLLHAHSPVLTVFPALWVGRRFRLPVVYEVRALWEEGAVAHGTSGRHGPRYRVSRILETYAVKRADAVTTICEGLRKDIVARGVDAGRVTVIPNAVNVDEFLPCEAPNEPLKCELGLTGMRVIGYIGSFYAYEGLDILVRALPGILARAANVRLLLVGGGPEEPGLRKLVNDLGIGDRVVFAGRVPHAVIESYYDTMNVLVYPRHSSRLTELVTPMKPLEAMAKAKLLVASDIGGHRELITHGVTGVLMRAGDAEALTRSVLDLLESPGRWPTLRRAAREFVIRERNWAASVGRYRRVYETCIADRATRARGRHRAS